jgi:hypothetical protein
LPPINTNVLPVFFCVFCVGLALKQLAGGDKVDGMKIDRDLTHRILKQAEAEAHAGQL